MGISGTYIEKAKQTASKHGWKLIDRRFRTEQVKDSTLVLMVKAGSGYATVLFDALKDSTQVVYTNVLKSDVHEKFISI